MFVSCAEVQITWGTGLGVDHERRGPGLQIIDERNSGVDMHHIIF